MSIFINVQANLTISFENHLVREHVLELVRGLSSTRRCKRDLKAIAKDGRITIEEAAFRYGKDAKLFNPVGKPNFELEKNKVADDCPNFNCPWTIDNDRLIPTAPEELYTHTEWLIWLCENIFIPLDVSVYGHYYLYTSDSKCHTYTVASFPHLPSSIVGPGVKYTLSPLSLAFAIHDEDPLEKLELAAAKWLANEGGEIFTDPEILEYVADSPTNTLKAYLVSMLAFDKDYENLDEYEVYIADRETMRYYYKLGKGLEYLYAKEVLYKDIDDWMFQDMLLQLDDTKLKNLIKKHNDIVFEGHYSNILLIRDVQWHKRQI